jgi:predicted transcriptional regulator of viral defense system
MHKNAIMPIVRSRQSVFRTADLALLWKIQEKDYLKNKIYRLVKSGSLIRLRAGLFAWSQEYDPLLVANKLLCPSYVSLQTILAQAGAIFQYDSRIYSVAQHSAQKEVDSKKYIYRKIRDLVFFQKKGVIIKNNVSLATKERAFMDWLYLTPSASVDNLSVLNPSICFDLLPLYKNSSLERRVWQCFKEKSMK